MVTFMDGLLGGVLGGVAQMLFVMLLAAILGRGWLWLPMLIGHTARPYVEVPDDDSRTIRRGLWIHVLVAAMFGMGLVLIVLIMPLRSRLWLWGLGYGALIWLVGRLGIVRAIDPTLAAYMNTLLFFSSHLVYGGVLGWWLQTLPLDL